MRPPAFERAGRWYRGNLHTHSNRSDGAAPPEQVVEEYRAAGYDFLVLSDHF
jgi:predicted metal-dependent phosphoesterase TrpH